MLYSFSHPSKAKFTLAKLLAATTMICGTLTSATHAAPLPWSPELSKPALQLNSPASEGWSASAAGDSAGNITAVWEESDTTGLSPSQVMYATHQPGTLFGKPQRLSDPAKDSSQPSIAMNQRGDTVVAWAVEHEITVVTKTAGKAFNTPQVVGIEDRVSHINVAINESGRILISWTSYSKTSGSKTKALAGNIDGPFEKPQILSTNDSFRNSAAIANDGRMIVGWIVYNFATGKNDYVETATRLPGERSFDSAKVISKPGFYTSLESLVFTANSDALVAITATDPKAAGISGTVEIAKSKKGSRAFSHPESISDPNPDLGPYDANIATNNAGETLVAWSQESAATSSATIQVARMNRDGTFSKPESISDSGQNAFGSKVALNENGDATVAWTVFTGSDFHIQSTYQPKGSGFTKPETISPDSTDAYVETVLTMTPNNSLVLWGEFDGTASSVQSRMF